MGRKEAVKVTQAAAFEQLQWDKKVSGVVI